MASVDWDIGEKVLLAFSASVLSSLSLASISYDPSQLLKCYRNTDFISCCRFENCCLLESYLPNKLEHWKKDLVVLLSICIAFLGSILYLLLNGCDFTALVSPLIRGSMRKE
jgi:hypothetical protein